MTKDQVLQMLENSNFIQDSYGNYILKDVNRKYRFKPMLRNLRHEANHSTGWIKLSSQPYKNVSPEKLQSRLDSFKSNQPVKITKPVKKRQYLTIICWQNDTGNTFKEIYTQWATSIEQAEDLIEITFTKTLDCDINDLYRSMFRTILIKGNGKVTEV